MPCARVICPHADCVTCGDCECSTVVPVRWETVFYHRALGGGAVVEVPLVGDDSPLIGVALGRVESDGRACGRRVWRVKNDDWTLHDLDADKIRCDIVAEEILSRAAASTRTVS